MSLRVRDLRFWRFDMEKGRATSLFESMLRWSRLTRRPMVSGITLQKKKKKKLKKKNITKDGYNQEVLFTRHGKEVPTETPKELA